ncbi:hypothetical protein LIA77_04103 [Sarocladium implicatum]|nr:hypothetical protein LIA77_04103 [Sarocladium implicatum]
MIARSTCVPQGQNLARLKPPKVIDVTEGVHMPADFSITTKSSDFLAAARQCCCTQTRFSPGDESQVAVADATETKHCQLTNSKTVRARTSKLGRDPQPSKEAWAKDLQCLLCTAVCRTGYLARLGQSKILWRQREMLQALLDPSGWRKPSSPVVPFAPPIWDPWTRHCLSSAEFGTRGGIGRAFRSFAGTSRTGYSAVVDSRRLL